MPDKRQLLKLNELFCLFGKFKKLKGNKIKNMIYVTQLIYILDGQEAAFNEFESVAILIIARYNGRLLLRYRTNQENIIEQSIDAPYEIHLVEFDSDEDLQNFFKDEERKKYVHLKEQSIKSVWLIKGSKL